MHLYLEWDLAHRSGLPKYVACCYFIPVAQGPAQLCSPLLLSPVSWPPAPAPWQPALWGEGSRRRERGCLVASLSTTWVEQAQFIASHQRFFLGGGLWGSLGEVSKCLGPTQVTLRLSPRSKWVKKSRLPTGHPTSWGP